MTTNQQTVNGSYKNSYQSYLKNKDNQEALYNLRASNQVTQLKAKITKNNPAPDCKICKVLSKPGDLPNVLNQGLFHKYTSSQDYFYTRDINAILFNKRKPVTIQHNDNVLFDSNDEFLKKMYRRKEAKHLMEEIKEFYSKFQDFPRHFELPHYKILNSNIRKHRKLEYIKVFQGDGSALEAVEGSNFAEKHIPKPQNEEGTSEFNLFKELGDSFLKDNYREQKSQAYGYLESQWNGSKPTSRNLDRSEVEIESNFKVLLKLTESQERLSPRLSDALYNKKFLLYSRQDSATAEQLLKDIVAGFEVKGGAAANESHQRSDVTTTNDTGDGGGFSPQAFPQNSKVPPLSLDKKVLNNQNFADDPYESSGLKQKIEKQKRITTKKSAEPSNNDTLQTPRGVGEDQSYPQTPRPNSSRTRKPTTAIPLSQRNNTPATTKSQKQQIDIANDQQMGLDQLITSEQLQHIYSQTAQKIQRSASGKKLIKIKQRPMTTAKKRIQDELDELNRQNNEILGDSKSTKLQELGASSTYTNSNNTLKVNLGSSKTQTNTAIHTRRGENEMSPLTIHARQHTLTQAPTKSDAYCSPQRDSAPLLSARMRNPSHTNPSNLIPINLTNAPREIGSPLRKKGGFAVTEQSRDGSLSGRSPRQAKVAYSIKKSNQGQMLGELYMNTNTSSSGNLNPGPNSPQKFLDSYYHPRSELGYGSLKKEPQSNGSTTIKTSNIYGTEPSRLVANINTNTNSSHKKNASSVGKTITVQTPQGNFKIAGIKSSKSIKNLRATQTYFPNHNMVATEFNSSPFPVASNVNSTLNLKAKLKSSEEKPHLLVPSVNESGARYVIHNENSNSEVLKHILVSKQKIKIANPQPAAVVTNNSNGNAGEVQGATTSLVKKPLLKKSESAAKMVQNSASNVHSSSQNNVSTASGKTLNSSKETHYAAHAKTTGIIILENNGKTLTAGASQFTRIKSKSKTLNTGGGATAGTSAAANPTNYQPAQNIMESYSAKKLTATNQKTRHNNHPNLRLNENQLYFHNGNTAKTLVTEGSYSNSIRNLGGGSGSYSTSHIKKLTYSTTEASRQSPIKITLSPSRKRFITNS